MIYINDHIDNLNIEAALATVSEQRRQQALRYKHDRQRRLCLAAYMLLKEALWNEYGIDGNPVFGYGEHGKPYLLEWPDIHFSLSHCQKAVACAVSHLPAGIDIECTNRYKESLMRHVMNKQEQGLIAQADNPAYMFTRLWTMKESQQKLTGDGLSTDLRDIIRTDVTFTTAECSQQGYIYTLCQYLPSASPK